MSYIMCCLDKFNRLTVWHFSVLDCGSACIVFKKFTQDWLPGTWFNIANKNFICDQLYNKGKGKNVGTKIHY